MFKKFWNKLKEEWEKENKVISEGRKRLKELEKEEKQREEEANKLLKELDIEKKIKEVIDVHQKVIDSYKLNGINVHPLNLGVASQEKLQEIQYGKKKTSNNYINGMCVSGLNSIILDEDFIKNGNISYIKHVIAHEYGHDISDRFRNSIYLNKKYGFSDSGFIRLPESTKDSNLIDKVLEGAPKLKPSLTKIEKRREEFKEYFEEMFVDSMAMYVNEVIDGEERFFSYSKIRQGEILKEDPEFMDIMESKLYEVFYDRMFTKGLKQVVAELPISFVTAMKTFEKRYRPILEKKPIAL